MHVKQIARRPTFYVFDRPKRVGVGGSEWMTTMRSGATLSLHAYIANCCASFCGSCISRKYIGQTIHHLERQRLPKVKIFRVPKTSVVQGVCKKVNTQDPNSPVTREWQKTRAIARREGSTVEYGTECIGFVLVKLLHTERQTLVPFACGM